MFRVRLMRVTARTAPGQFFVRGFASLPPHELIRFPALSPTMTSGKLSTWKKQEGDEISVGDVLLTVQTDKAENDYEVQDDGYLAKILVPEDTDDVKVGTVIGVMVRNLLHLPITFATRNVTLQVEDEGDISAFKDFEPPKEEESSAPAPSPEPAPAPSPAPAPEPSPAPAPAPAPKAAPAPAPTSSASPAPASASSSSDVSAAQAQAVQEEEDPAFQARWSAPGLASFVRKAKSYEEQFGSTLMDNFLPAAKSE